VLLEPPQRRHGRFIASERVRPRPRSRVPARASGVPGGAIRFEERAVRVVRRVADVRQHAGVVHHGCGDILAVGAGAKGPIVSGDRVEVGTLMSCTLSGDHRVVDGAVGAELLNAVKQLLEEPVRMLV